MSRGQPLFASDRDHIHHRLLDRGATPSAVAIQIYIASILVSLVCIAVAIADHFVLGLGIAGVALLALFSARVLGYLEWGGWAARWSGRAETRVLHAAMALARLKIRQADDDAGRLRAVAVAAAEMGCLRIEWVRGDQHIEWVDPYDPADLLELGGGVVELPVDDQTTVSFTMADATKLDDERSQLLEELCQELRERL